MKEFLKKYIKPTFTILGIYSLSYRLYFFTIQSLARFFNIYRKSFRRTAPILLYHRIADLKKDPVSLAVTLKCFEEHIIFLKKNYNIVSLSELNQRISNRNLQGNELCITFDDGYRDNLYNALPILKHHNVPATIFITTGHIGQKASFEWDMEYSEEDRASFLSEIEIKSLSENSLMEIGAHTENHARLSTLSEDEQEKEIYDSKVKLEKIIGKPVTLFAYPFGGLYDFNNSSKCAVLKAGLNFAYSNIGLLASNSYADNLLAIPRMNIRECSVSELSKKLLISNKIIMIISRILPKIYRYSYSLLISPFTKKVSKKDFYRNYQEVKDFYIKTKSDYIFKDFIVPQWMQNVEEIENYFINSFSFGFLNNIVIKNTMFVYSFKGWRDIQKRLIEKVFGNDSAKLLHEYNIGRPLLNDAKYITSGNSIHHLYHISKFIDETKEDKSSINTVVEVGGGYGNMAKIFKNINPHSTYIILDVPIFSCIQAVYLKTIFGADSVNISHGDDIRIINGKINLIPLNKNSLHLINENISNIKPDIFISTWALSESNDLMQQYIKDCDYFESRYLLLAYQKSVESFSFAEDVTNINNTYEKVFNEETEYTPDNYYLFCKRKE